MYRNRIVIVGGAGRLARAAILMLEQMYSRTEIVCMAGQGPDRQRDVYDFKFNGFHEEPRSLKQQQVTYGPQRKGKRGKPKRW